MQLNTRIVEFQNDMVAWRREIHAHPEEVFAVERTAGKMRELLLSFGVDDVIVGVGRTGVVGLIHGRDRGPLASRTIGLRAELDALPIQEEGQRAYRSCVEGKMHACGHDGHMSMLLGAARYLAETRNFAGTVAVIFQPAEEGGGGAQAMVDDGVLERFGIDEIYGLHNLPGLPLGHFSTRAGPLFSSADRMEIEFRGIGGHSAYPHDCVDPILTASAFVVAAQQIVSRNVSPMKSAVVSINRFHSGVADNAIPQSARVTVDIRTTDATLRDFVEKRLREIAQAMAATYGASAKIEYFREYPVTVNDAACTEFAVRVAKTIVGDEAVDAQRQMTMGAEDFGVMLDKRPGCIFFVGNGDGPGLHHPEHDFNDKLLPIGASYWVQLVESALPLRASADRERPAAGIGAPR
jgi:amidohydrolase